MIIHSIFKKAILVFTQLLLFSEILIGQSIFKTACQGNIDRLDSLLQEQSIQVRDSRGRSLLHWAVGCKRDKVIQHVLEKGIDLNATDLENRSALNVAVQFNNPKLFDMLVAAQNDDSWKKEQGAKLLETAVLKENKDFIRKLSGIGIDINVENERGSSALEIAKRIKAKDVYNLLLSLGAEEQKIRTFSAKGPYLGQLYPQKKALEFAPNLISTEESEFGSVFSSNGKEFYYAVDVNGKNEIRYTKMENQRWSDPVVLLSHDRYGYNDPFLSNDEQRLYFISKQPLNGQGEEKDVDIWYIEKRDDSWSDPINAGKAINTSGDEYYISFTKEGNMYFSSNGHHFDDSRNDHDIYCSRFMDGEFQKAQVLPNTINSRDYEADVFIDPDERYMIFCSSRDGGYGRGDLYISFRKEEGEWSRAINMGEKVNSSHYEYCPFVSKDGQFLFFTRHQDIFWISTDIITELNAIGE